MVSKINPFSGASTSSAAFGATPKAKATKTAAPTTTPVGFGQLSLNTLVAQTAQAASGGQLQWTKNPDGSHQTAFKGYGIQFQGQHQPGTQVVKDWQLTFAASQHAGGQKRLGSVALNVPSVSEVSPTFAAQKPLETIAFSALQTQGQQYVPVAQFLGNLHDKLRLKQVQFQGNTIAPHAKFGAVMGLTHVAQFGTGNNKAEFVRMGAQFSAKVVQDGVVTKFGRDALTDTNLRQAVEALFGAAKIDFAKFEGTKPATTRRAASS